MKAGWTLEDIDWNRFDPGQVDPTVVPAVKAAAMVEFNAADYVIYLKKVFAGDPDMIAKIEQWGEEETQHGRALAKWAQLADPSFDFDAAFKRFREGFHIPVDANASVRGSCAGEMIARCVVESGTSSFYSGMRDNSPEPVLKQIAAHIAADEFRHYKLFLEGFEKYQPKEAIGIWDRMKIAVGRVVEAEDDELAYAFYAANVPEGTEDYDRDHFSREYNKRILQFYKWPHVKKGVAMIAKAVGLKPTGALSRSGAKLLWWALQARAKAMKPAQEDAAMDYKAAA